MLYLFELKPSGLGWGVLAVVGAALWAFGAWDALRARREVQVKVPGDAAGGPPEPPRSRLRRFQ